MLIIRKNIGETFDYFYADIFFTPCIKKHFRFSYLDLQYTDIITYKNCYNPVAKKKFYEFYNLFKNVLSLIAH